MKLKKLNWNVHAGKICLLIIIAVCVFAIFAAKAEKPHLSIQEILKQQLDSAGKIEISTARGNYAVSVEIPQVDTVPILLVTHPDYNQMPPPPENSTVEAHLIGDALLGWHVSMQEDALIGEFVKNTARIGQYGLNSRADGSPLTMEGAISFTDRMLSTYAAQGWEYRLHRCFSMSRMYRAAAGRNGFAPDLSKPVSETGYYTLEYDQILHGIPYCGRVLFSYPGKYDRTSPSYDGFCIFTVFSPDCWSYTLYAAVQTEVLANDVPLCDVETIVKALRQSCKNTPGTPAVLRFVYKAWDHPEDPNGDLVLLPMWILENDDGPDNHGAQMACINAQTGELIDENSKDRNRYHAVWLEWEDL